MSIITRFAPSPTGELHIGSARTALFNYLYTRNRKGKFYIRIEDTDLMRSDKKFTNSILEGLKWLGIEYNGEIVYQSRNQEKHLKLAQELVDKDQAYYCYISKEEIDNMRKIASQKKENFVFRSPYRDKNVQPDTSIDPVIRLKIPQNGQIVLDDQVQGRVVIDNAGIEDAILVRSNSIPTYMLSVVSDDIDMNITHIIRGVDHLTNSFRQALIYRAIGKNLPILCHIPLIHGMDGTKLSKRHGALSITDYKRKGYLPEAINNSLLRLGWSHGNDEIISITEAIEWFDLKHIGKSAAKFDLARLDFLNSSYIKEKDNKELMKMLSLNLNISPVSESAILNAMPTLKTRVKNLIELSEYAKLYTENYIVDLSIIKQMEVDNIMRKAILQLINNIRSNNLDNTGMVKDLLKSVSNEYDIKFGNFMKIVRLLMTGLENSPSIFEMMVIISRKEIIRRLNAIDDI